MIFKQRDAIRDTMDTEEEVIMGMVTGMVTVMAMVATIFRKVKSMAQKTDSNAFLRYLTQSSQGLRCNY